MLGVEVLIANMRSEKVEFIYDKGAVFLLIMMSCFTLLMALVDYGIQNSGKLSSSGFIF